MATVKTPISSSNHHRRQFLQSLGGGALALHALPALADGLLSTPFVKNDRLAQNPFLSGNYGPIRQETLPTQVKVIEGEIPQEIRGTYIRNGPNPLFPPTPYHWFDGDGMLHALTLNGGHATYQSRLVRTEGLRKELGARRNLYGGIIAGGPPKNTANTSVLWHHNRMLALWEGGSGYEIDPQTLATNGTYLPEPDKQPTLTAHPKIDPRTGNLVFFGLSRGQSYHIRMGELSKNGKLLYSSHIDMEPIGMVHDCAISEHYFVVLDFPAPLRPESPAPDRTRLGLLRRGEDGRHVKWFDIDGGFVFHMVNAYEEQDTVVVHGCRHERFPAFDHSPPRPRLWQWRLHLKSGLVEETPLSEQLVEFPILHPQQVSQAYSSAYFMSGEGLMGSSIVSYDAATHTMTHHPFGENRFGGEPIWIPDSKAPGSADDGWLIIYIHDESTNQSEALLIDVRDFQGPPVARIHLPSPVPYGFHGAWVPNI